MIHHVLSTAAAFANAADVPVAGDMSHITKAVITGAVVLFFVGLVFLVRSGSNKPGDRVDQAVDSLGNFQI